MKKRVLFLIIGFILLGGIAVVFIVFDYPRVRGARWDQSGNEWGYAILARRPLKVSYDLTEASEYRDKQRQFSFRYPKEWKVEQRANGMSATFSVERNTLLWSPERQLVFSLAVDERPESEYLATRGKGSWGRYAAIEQEQTQFLGGVPWLIYDLPAERRDRSLYPYPKGILEFGDWRLIVHHFQPEIFATLRYTGPLPTIAQPSINLAFTFKPFLETENLVAYSGRKGSLLIRKDDRNQERVVYTPEPPDDPPHGFSWSPDGKRLIFFESKTGDLEKKILLADLFGGKVYLVRQPGDYGNVAWSPASDKIAFIEVHGSSGTLRIIGLPRRMDSEDLIISQYFPLPGVGAIPRTVQWVGEDIYYDASSGGLMKFNPERKEILPVVANNGIVAFSISAASQKLTYALSTGELYLRDLSQPSAGDRLVEDFLSDNGGDYVEELNFSPDGRMVLGYYPLGNYFLLDTESFALDSLTTPLPEFYPAGNFWQPLSQGKVLFSHQNGLFYYNLVTKKIERVKEIEILLYFGVHN